MAAERAFTDSLRRFFGSAAGVQVGIGDDAAVVVPRGRSQVLCCDPVVEGVHFRPDADLALVGRKAVNRNLSDVAAMGGHADWLLVSLVLPAALTGTRRLRLLRGIRAAAGAGGAAVIGGDVAVHRGPLVVTVTAIGHLTSPPLRREAARVGDTIHVTGPLGGSSLGRHLRFRPRLDEGQWLAQQRGVGAAMDVSDGLLLDLATLLRASGGCGAEIDADAVPIAAAARRLARGDAEAALGHALGDGEDHELLFTVRRGRRLPGGGPLTAAARRPIGRVIARHGLWLLGSDGRRQRLQPQGWQHAL
ncbi:MAG: thiamine-phosphate kinase [Planctomycetes bacterium]|nr:thiamine-phosphate kinase [Planctomycetota bacterium]